MSAVPVSPHSRPPAASPTWRSRRRCASPSGRARWRRSRRPAGSARRPLLAAAGRRRVGLDHRLARCSTSRRSRARRSSGRRRSTRFPASAPCATGTSCRRSSSVSCSTRCCSPASASSRASRCSRAAGVWPGRAFLLRRSPAPRLPSNSSSASRWPSRWSRSRRCMHLPHMIWELVIVFVLVLAPRGRRADDRAAQRARPARQRDRGPLVRAGALLAAARHVACAGCGHVLVGRPDRGHLGGARGLRHPRRARRRRSRLRLLDDRAAVPLLARATSASSSSASAPRS